MVAGLPAIFMSVMTIWAVIMNQFTFLDKQNMLLTVINVLILIIAVWIAVEGLMKFFSSYGTSAGEPETETT